MAEQVNARRHPVRSSSLQVGRHTEKSGHDGGSNPPWYTKQETHVRYVC